MLNEIRLLIVNNKMFTLVKKTTEAYGLLCQPHKIGEMAVAFANADLSNLINFNRFREMVNKLITDDDIFYESIHVQEIVMGIINCLDSYESPMWFFAVERLQLEELERKIVTLFPRKKDVLKEISVILSRLESLVQFQETLREMLCILSLSEKKSSNYASNAQILCSLFDRFPKIVESCCGTMGYMIIDVDDQGKIRTEMLNRNWENAFRTVLTPEKGLLKRNDINDNKAIAEFHVLSDVKMCIMYDLIEGLRRSSYFAQCGTCKKFFLTSDKRQAYCVNKECRTDTARMRRRKERIEADPVLLEANRFKNTMTSRCQRTQNAAKENRIKNLVSREAYEEWLDLYYKERAFYKNVKAETLLCDNPQETIRKAGDAFLAKIKPKDYIDKHSSS